MIAGSRRKLHFLAKHEHFERFVTRFVVSSTGQIKTVREEGGGDALSTASGILDSGRCMGIFPEGTRSRNLQPPFLGKGKTGIARLAASYPNVLIIPVVCQGTRNFMQPKKHKFPSTNLITEAVSDTKPLFKENMPAGTRANQRTEIFLIY